MEGQSRRRFLIAGLCMAVAPRQAASAENYPDRPIRIIIPYQAGGVAETIMRLLSPKMEELLGQKLVIEAKPGAAGNVGTLEVARAAPDGYTVLVAAANNFVINQFLIKMPVDPLVALAPIANVADVPLVLFSNAETKARSLQDFVELARASPGSLSYGSPSRGTVNHLLIERLKQAAGVDIVHVPFRGSPAAVLALLANQIQLLPLGLGGASAHLSEGKLTTIAVATERRLPMLPDTPTMSESGFPGFVAANWWGMAAPAGTPANVIQTLHRAATTALQEPIVATRFKTMGMLIPNGTPAQFAATLKPQAELWQQTIERGRIRME
jgi:tripartite-type tricarboxylate transporter receptor subunit TctC